jgi:mono/diheme cytochrome c family protein
LATSLVAPARFLAVAGWLLMIALVHPASGVSAQATAASGNEVSVRSGNSPMPPTAATATVLENGRRIFLRDCAHCHGERGDGVSRNMRTLHPAPFDLTSFELADLFIQRMVREGLPGADMPGWRLGSDEEVHAVSAYTARLGRRDTLSTQESYAPPAALREAGHRIYTMHCINCHGEQGKGDGPDAAKHLPQPASFAEMRPSYAAARRAIENGVRGTDMPSWPLLTAPEIQAVTFYIRTLYMNSRSSTGARP